MLRRRVLVFLLTAAFLAAVMPSASASPVTVSFSGMVTDDPFGLGFSTFTGTYTFDSAASDGAADPSTGSYTSVGPTYGISAIFDSGAATANVAGMLNIGIANDFAGPVDQYTATGLAGVTELGLFLEDTNASVFSSDALPALPPPLAAFVFRQFRWFDTDIEILGTIDTLACINGCGAIPAPEPGTAALLAMALPLLWAARRRSTRSVVPS